MARINTVTGETFQAFFREKLPKELHERTAYKLRVLKNSRRDCVGAFVFPRGDRYAFRVEDTSGLFAADIYISFLDDNDLIIVIDAVVLKGVYV